MAEEIPIIPKVNTLHIHSGNIVNWNRLKRKPNQTPTEELAECVSGTLTACLPTKDRNELQASTEWDCKHTKFMETLPADERGDLKVTVKLFLCNLMPIEELRNAVSTVQQELNITMLETLLLGFPEIEDQSLSLEMIKPYWKVLEELVREECVLSLGISDADKELLEELYEWASIKPMINQVNLESCCVMPKDLVAYAKEKDIQLLTHNDSRDIMPVKRFKEIMASNLTEKDSERWEPQWAIRYSVLVKCRGIIKTKGYILKVDRDIKQRKV